MKIETLQILTKNLEEQTAFYNKILGLEIIAKEEKEVSFKIGLSILKLVYSEDFTPYHYAINIPSNQSTEALKWLKKRVAILKDGIHEIQDFDFWNAKAVYFYDKDNNIVELIARKNLKIQSNLKFSSSSLLNISEIGMLTQNIIPLYERLKNISGLNIYDGTTERFCAIGDENGLFIAINKKLKTKWFPTEDKPFSSPFIIDFKEKGKAFKFEFKNDVLDLNK